jgi:hypothetical protein
MRDHLSAGKNLFLTTIRLVGTEGLLDDDSAMEILGIKSFHMNKRFTPPETNFTLQTRGFFIGGSASFDSLRSAGVFGGVESYELLDEGEAAYLAVPGALDTLPPDPWPVGVNRRFGPGQGRLVYLGFPLRFMNRSFPSGEPGRAAIELQKVFDLFGIPQN